jgi:hypothetical protein
VSLLRLLLGLGLWAAAIAPVVARPSANPPPAKATTAPKADRCPIAFEPMVGQLLQDLPHYANRLIVKSRKLGGPPPGNYVMVISPPDFQALPLPGTTSGQASPEGSIAPGDLRQVFFTSLERQYATRQITSLQGFHWSVWAPSPQGWQLVTLRSQLGPAPVGQSPLAQSLQTRPTAAEQRIWSPPREADYSPLAEGIRLWLRDCGRE